MRNAATPRFVHGSTRMTIFVLITALACGGILLTQRGLFAVLGGDFAGSWAPALTGVSMMTAAFTLARFRNDLIDD